MLSPDAVRQGQHVMAVCNACRYCEGYCPVFPAMENRLVFAKHDLAYLANLCHNCGECLYACQYAPPHEFGINVPRTLATIRQRSYEQYCWPRALGGLFRRNSVVAALGLAAASTVVMFLAAWLGGGRLFATNPQGDFYAVVPHAAMVALFGAVGLFVAVAIAIGVIRFWRDIQRDGRSSTGSGDVVRGLRDALTLRHLHSTGPDCTSGTWHRDGDSEIWVYDFQEKKARSILAESFRVSDSALSPDGRYLAYTSEAAAVVSLGIIEGRWKAVAARPDTGRGRPGPAAAATAASALRIAVEFNNMTQWQVISRQLAQTPDVSDLEVEGLSARGARLSLRYPGGPERLAAALAEYGLTLRATGGGWILTAR